MNFKFKQRNKRKTFLVCFILLGLLLLAGCAESPDEVKIASTKSICAYAATHYGAASSYEVTEEENSRTVTFTDREYGFTYTVKSHPAAVGIPGASPFGYTERKTSDFSQCYYRALYDLAENEFQTEYDIHYGYCLEDGYECHVYNVSADDAGKAAEEIGRYLKKLDTRNFYGSSDACVKAYSSEQQGYIGSWHISDGKYYYYADEEIERMTLNAEAVINSGSTEKKKIKYLYWEQMDISEVPGIGGWELVDHTIDDGTVTTLYWFSIDGEKHFFADIKVWNIGDEYYSDMIVDRRRN